MAAVSALLVVSSVVTACLRAGYSLDDTPPATDLDDPPAATDATVDLTGPDGPPCTSGMTRSCYRGPAGTAGIGECQAGAERCAGGTWSGVCSGEVHPVSDICDGLDNDCNGTADLHFDAPCGQLSCSGQGLIKTVENLCMDDYGGSALSDALQVYCCSGVARFCLSNEACPWRSECPPSSEIRTCSPAGLSGERMAHIHQTNDTCTGAPWQGHTHFSCTATGMVHFNTFVP